MTETTAPAITTAERNYRTVKAISTGYTVATLGVSAFHLVELSIHFGGGWQSFLAPALVDGFVILGKLGDRPGIVKSARTASRAVSIIAGSVSLAANIAIGIIDHAPAVSLIGALAVIGFWVAEFLSHKLRPTTKRPAAPKPAPKPAPAAAAPAAPVKSAKDPKRVEAARKAAATRAARKAAPVAPVAPVSHPDAAALVDHRTPAAYI
jgi:hypothetical protein